MPRDFLVADAERMDDREIPGMPGFEKTFLDSGMQASGFHQTATAADQADRVAILDQCHRLFCADEFVDGHELSPHIIQPSRHADWLPRHILLVTLEDESLPC